jgi:hypothetical protein
VIDRVCGAVPLVGVTVSQGESLAAVKESVPDPEFDTSTESALGFEPPNVALNVTVDSETARVANGASLPLLLLQPEMHEASKAHEIMAAGNFITRSSVLERIAKCAIESGTEAAIHSG